VGLYHAHALNLLSQGDEVATHLGVDVPRARRALLLAASLMIGASVAVSGLIGFVGLIAPHLLRMLRGADHRWLVPASALLGAAFLALADSLARTLLAPNELPVGALTALIGGPLFLVLLRRELSAYRP
jgi:iron complex transport system permease protein